MATFGDLAKDVWVVILEQLQGAEDCRIVMDDPSAELFHWAGGQELIRFPERIEIWRFLDFSALNLKSTHRTDVSMAFVLCRVIGEEELDQIATFLSSPQDSPRNCWIFTAYSDEVQSKHLLPCKSILMSFVNSVMFVSTHSFINQFLVTKEKLMSRLTLTALSISLLLHCR